MISWTRITRSINRPELEATKRSKNWVRVAPFLSVILGLGVILASLLAVGEGSFSAFFDTFAFFFSSMSGITETCVILAPLATASLGISVAYKAGFWNIGGEGQILLGALLGLVISLNFPTGITLLSKVIPALGAFAVSGVFCLLVAKLKTSRGVDEVLVTLLSNFVFIYLISFLISGPLQDPATQWIQSSPLPEEFRFSRIPSFGRANSSLLVLGCLFVTLLYFERRTLWNTIFEVTGDSHLAARSQGVNPSTVVMLAGFVSGGLCGLSGWIEMAGVQFRLIENLTPGYGYFALLVAVLSKGRILPTLLYALLFSVVLNGLDVFTRDAKLPTYVGDMILGLSLLGYMMFARFGSHRLRIRS